MKNKDNIDFSETGEYCKNVTCFFMLDTIVKFFIFPIIFYAIIEIVLYFLLGHDQWMLMKNR